jgi:hypothetical protein
VLDVEKMREGCEMFLSATVRMRSDVGRGADLRVLPDRYWTYISGRETHTWA